MENQIIIEALKEFGIKTEREVDVAFKNSIFSLGIMAAGTLIPLALRDKQNTKNDLFNVDGEERERFRKEA